MANTNQEKRSEPAASAKPKSAMDKLLRSMDELADSAANKMTPNELRSVRKDIHEAVDRAASARQRRRRETA